MNWENSKALTPLKRDFLLAFFQRERGFYLTGGSALGIFYLEHRLSYDLDLFSTGPVEWHDLSAAFIDSANEIKAQWKAISSSPYIHRFELLRDTKREIIDFIAEKVPQLDEKKVEIGSLRIDTLREIGANKLCTILGRSEIKDFIDLYFLEKSGFKVIEHIDDAKKKDGGMDPATLSFLISQIEINEIPNYVLKPLTTEELRSFLTSLQKQLALKAYPEK